MVVVLTPANQPTPSPLFKTLAAGAPITRLLIVSMWVLAPKSALDTDSKIVVL